MAAVAARLALAFPKTNQGVGARIVPIWKAQDGASSILASPLGILGAAGGLVLLIACANVTNLLLARSISRQREFGIRAALGAGPGRLGRQLVSESLLLAALATLAGLPLALWFQDLPVYLVPPTGIPVYLNAHSSARVFLFAALVCLASALLSGLPPAFQSVRRSVVDALKQGGRSDTQSGTVATHLRASCGGGSGPGIRGARDARIVSPEPLRIGEHSGRIRSPQRDGSAVFS